MNQNNNIENNKKLPWTYFISVISVNQCSINNDFEGIRLNSDGIIYTTDVSRKYLMKRYMKDELEINIAGLPDKTSNGMYQYLKNNKDLIKTLESFPKKPTEQLEIMNNKYKDISMFGYLFTDTFGNGKNEDKNSKIELKNSTLTGYVQVSNGINIGNNNNIINMTIINGNKDKDTSTSKKNKENEEENEEESNNFNEKLKSGSVGSKQIIEEAYIANTVFVNPNQYRENFCLFNDIENIKENFEKDISTIETTLTNDANSFRTASRNNIFNEILIKIQSDVALNIGKQPLVFENGKIVLSTKLQNKINELKDKNNIVVTEILNETK